MFNTIKLEKSLYSITGKSFTQALEELDGSSAYENTDMKGLDAFERQLKRFDIKISGVNSDTVEKFFSTTESAVLFPEFVRRAIKQGMEEASLIPAAVSAVTKISGIDYRGLAVSSMYTSNEVLEGGALPATTIKLASSATAVSKLGRRISASYEAIRTQRLDVFAVTLKAIGAQLSCSVNSKIISALTAEAVPVEPAGEALSYGDLLSLWAEFGDYNMTTVFVAPSVMAEILTMEQMESAQSGELSGSIKTPFGAMLVKTTAVSEAAIVGIDKSCALEMVLATDVVVDFDKLISTQMEDIAFSITVGFSKIIPNAVKVLSLE
jgi:hypothetical protein